MHTSYYELSEKVCRLGQVRDQQHSRLHSVLSDTYTCSIHHFQNSNETCSFIASPNVFLFPMYTRMNGEQMQ